MKIMNLEIIQNFQLNWIIDQIRLYILVWLVLKLINMMNNLNN